MELHRTSLNDKTLTGNTEATKLRKDYSSAPHPARGGSEKYDMLAFENSCIFNLFLKFRVQKKKIYFRAFNCNAKISMTRNKILRWVFL